MAKKHIKRPQQYKKPKDPTFKEMWQAMSAEKQQLVKIVALIAVAVIVLFILWYSFIFNDGSLRVRNGAIVGGQDNWLVAECDGGKNSDYYHIADMGTPEGFVTETDKGYATNSTSLRSDFSFVPAEPGEGKVGSAYVSAVGKSVEDMITSVHASFSGMTANDGAISEVFAEETAQGTAKYFTYQTSYPNEDGTGTTYTQALVYYLPTLQKDACVLISINGSYETPEMYLEDSVLYAAAQTVKAAVTMPEK